MNLSIRMLFQINFLSDFSTIVATRKGSSDSDDDDIVRSFKTYDVYYLSGYARAFEQNGDEKAVLIYFEKEDTRAINVVMKRDIADCDEFKTEIV